MLASLAGRGLGPASAYNDSKSIDSQSITTQTCVELTRVVAMKMPPDHDPHLPGASQGDRAELPVIDLASRDPLPELPAHPIAPNRLDYGAINLGDGKSATSLADAPLDADAQSDMFWFSGDVLMCACPECSAPMTVRIWLMVADCWRCETSIELTEEQEREARRLLERRARQSVQRDAPTGSRQPTPSDAGAIRNSAAQVSYVAVAPAVGTSGARVTHEPSAPPRAAPQSVAGQLRRRRRGANRISNWLHGLIKSMPAWLVSLLFHVLLLTILGLLTSQKDQGPYITLSSRISRMVREGGDTRIIDPLDKSVFDLGVPDSIDFEDPALRRAVVRADQDARELRLTDPTNPYLPDLSNVKRDVQSPTRRSLAVRDPRVRIEMVRKEGGTTLTEAAVARGLRWLAEHQNKDGSWSLDAFHRACRCNCGGRGSISSDSAGTSLALLPFLGAGQTHWSGVYKDTVARGLRWLIQHQRPNGDLRGSSRQYPGMYAQGQGTIVLCEAFLMTGDEELRIPAQKAVDFIVAAQYPDGGWRYYPRDDARSMRGDTSVLGWQLMALQSALAADLSVPEETLENADHFLDSVQHADGALYSYLPREEHSAPMTAEGLLCRIYLGWKHNHPSLRQGVTWMLEKEPPSIDQPDIYYWYYATQTIHHFGEQYWDTWNLQMRDVLVATQEIRGHAAGSWSPRGPLTSQGGRIYMTSLAICCLEVYYRHLPLFRQIDLE